jgi:uncharacterized protein YjbJ (UPF0337 family)
MTQSTNDQVAGAVHELKGAVKEKAGQLANKPELEQEGADEKLAGTIQRKIGEVEKVFNK